MAMGVSAPFLLNTIDIIHGTGLETQSINTFRPSQSVLRAGGRGFAICALFEIIRCLE